QAWELLVQWQVDGNAVLLRLIISWNRRTKEFCYLVTNLPAKRYHLDMICRAYKWRWHVEVLYSQDIKFRRDAFFFLVGGHGLLFKGQYMMYLNRPIPIHHYFFYQ